MAVNYKKQIEVRDFRNGSWFWVQTHVWRDKRLSKSDKIVYATVASYVNENQNSFPSIETIGKDGDISPRQVHYSIKKLEDIGYLNIKRRRGKSNYYDLLKTSAISAPLQPMQTTPAKSTVGTPAENGVRTISILTRTNNKRRKQINSLRLTTQQLRVFAREFSGLTIGEIKEQSKKCSDYMAMSSTNYTNPGLFFRGWMKKFYPEWKKEKAVEVREEEAKKTLDYKITDEERERNLIRIAEIKSKLPVKTI